MTDTRSELSLLAAKLIGASKGTPSCPTCLGAGYSWNTIGPYTIPILCLCKNNTKTVTLRDKAAIDLDNDRASNIVEFIVKISDVIPSQGKVPALAQFIYETYRHSITRDAILGYNINEENIDSALDSAVDALLEGSFSEEVFMKVKSLLKGT